MFKDINQIKNKRSQMEKTRIEQESKKITGVRERGESIMGNVLLPYILLTQVRFLASNMVSSPLKNHP